MVDGPETNPWCNRVTSTEIDRKEDRRNDASWLSIAAGPPSTPLRTSNHTAGSSRGTRTRLRWRLPGLGTSRGPSSSGRAGESPRGPVPASPERGPAMLLPTKPGDGGLPNHMPPQKGRRAGPHSAESHPQYGGIAFEEGCSHSEQPLARRVHSPSRSCPTDSEPRPAQPHRPVAVRVSKRKPLSDRSTAIRQKGSAFPIATGQPAPGSSTT